MHAHRHVRADRGRCSSANPATVLGWANRRSNSSKQVRRVAQEGPPVAPDALSTSVSGRWSFRTRSTMAEGPLLDQALRLAQGENIYRMPGAEPPWTISNYPPLYPLIESAASQIFGPTYWYGRATSLLSAVEDVSILSASTPGGVLPLGASHRVA